MAPALNVGDIVFVSNVTKGALRVGDIVAYRVN
jgi:signal peptidase I